MSKHSTHWATQPPLPVTNYITKENTSQEMWSHPKPLTHVRKPMLRVHQHRSNKYLGGKGVEIPTGKWGWKEWHGGGGYWKDKEKSLAGQAESSLMPITSAF